MHDRAGGLTLLRIDVHSPLSLILCHGMIEGEREVLASLGLFHITFMSEIRSNSGLLTTLVERWHSKMSLFHLPLGEAIVTLEDVWCILKIHKYRELVVYDPTTRYTTLHKMFGCGDVELGIRDYEIG